MPDFLAIAPIVEGHGEIDAVPILLHRIANHLGHPGSFRINNPIRVKSGSFLNDEGYFKKYIGLAAAKVAQSDGLVLVLLDCDDDCPALLGPNLLVRARRVRPDIRHLVVLAYREFETWFLAAAESLGGQVGLPENLAAPLAFENIRDAKGWLNARMVNGYDPISHQHKLTRLFSIEQARTASSFRRFCDRIASVLAENNQERIDK